MEVPPRLRQRRGAIHAGDAAFWAVYENAGAWATLTLAYALMAADFFRDWVEEVAKEPMEVPVVPRNLGLAGIDLAWAHTGIYRRIVGDARRSVSAQELVSRSARSLGVIREAGDLRVSAADRVRVLWYELSPHRRGLILIDDYGASGSAS